MLGMQHFCLLSIMFGGRKFVFLLLGGAGLRGLVVLGHSELGLLMQTADGVPIATFFRRKVVNFLLFFVS